MTDKKRQPEHMQTDQQPAEAALGGMSADNVFPLELQGAIGKQLKQVYGQMLAEPLPDKFSKLLEQLGKLEGK
jgi:Anti-sigma factor NepR